MNDAEKLEVKTTKTLLVLGAMTLCTLPIYLVNGSLGVLTTLVADAALLYHFHEQGKARRPGSNAINAGLNLFSANTGLPPNNRENQFRNIINGGAADFDELAVIAHRLQNGR